MSIAQLNYFNCETRNQGKEEGKGGGEREEKKKEKPLSFT